jgi:5'-methylthioadenosine phosphorylase
LADIGVIGGSGLYEFLEAIDEVVVETPFGMPSDPVVIGEVAGRRVAFLPRHGRDHLPDQIVDRTTSRAQTFYDEGGAVHVQFADPYCPVGRARAIAAATDSGWAPVPSATLVIIEGPRFSTRAESRWYAAQSWTLIGMTALPEAVLARELALCYTTIALVTDTDAGVEEGEGVTQAEVFRVFAANIERLRDVLMKVIESLPEERNCPCPHALDGLKLPVSLP